MSLSQATRLAIIGLASGLVLNILVGIVLESSYTGPGLLPLLYIIRFASPALLYGSLILFFVTLRRNQTRQDG